MQWSLFNYSTSHFFLIQNLCNLDDFLTKITSNILEFITNNRLLLDPHFYRESFKAMREDEHQFVIASVRSADEFLG